MLYFKLRAEPRHSAINYVLALFLCVSVSVSVRIRRNGKPIQAVMFYSEPSVKSSSAAVAPPPPQSLSACARRQPRQMLTFCRRLLCLIRASKVLSLCQAGDIEGFSCTCNEKPTQSITKKKKKKKLKHMM